MNPPIPGFLDRRSLLVQVLREQYTHDNGLAQEPPHVEIQENIRLTEKRLSRRGEIETILVVEDEPTLRGAIRRLLERDGYAVLTASTPSEAIELAVQHGAPIHLLLTDFVLPGATGRQLADVLTPDRPGLRVLYMSGHVEADLAPHRDAAFLQKPFRMEALLRQVRALLDMGRPPAEAAAGQ